MTPSAARMWRRGAPSRRISRSPWGPSARALLPHWAWMTAFMLLRAQRRLQHCLCDTLFSSVVRSPPFQTAALRSSKCRPASSGRHCESQRQRKPARGKGGGSPAVSAGQQVVREAAPCTASQPPRLLPASEVQYQLLCSATYTGGLQQQCSCECSALLSQKL